MLAELLHKRLVFVAGKGGVGRSTVAAALGLAAARAGARTVIAEVSGQDRAACAFGRRGEGLREIELTAGLHAVSIDPQAAMEEYLHVKAGRLADLLKASRTFNHLAAATPGMRELLTIGKAWELAQDRRRTRGGAPYDLVIVDAPATGHGAGMLRAPRTFAEIAGAGPIAHQARTISATLSDPRTTGVLAVALAEEMPVSETLALRGEVRDAVGLELDAVIVNALAPLRLGPRQAGRVARVAGETSEPLAREALRAALAGHERALAQREQLAALAAGLGTPPIELPFVFAPRIGPAELELLAGLIAGAATSGNGLRDRAPAPARGATP